MELQGSKPNHAEKALANQRLLARDRKLALLQHVDNLKKKLSLRYEENVHRALERAINRPLGALSRLPSYLPQYALGLVAEVAVLEEAVFWPEKQVLNFRHCLYQEPVHICSRRNTENTESLIRCSELRHSRSLSYSEVDMGSFVARPWPSLSRSAANRKSEDTLKCLIRDVCD